VRVGGNRWGVLVVDSKTRVRDEEERSAARSVRKTHWQFVGGSPMNKFVYLEDEFLYTDDVMPSEGTETDRTSPSVFDIPRSVTLSDGPGGELLLQFVYTDSEKLMTLRVRGGAAAVPAVSARIRALAPVQKRKNQELNFLLLSNILDKKRAELLA
jgi:hypothetical protein